MNSNSLRDLSYLLAGINLPGIQSVIVFQVDYIPENLFLNLDIPAIYTKSIHFKDKITDEGITIPESTKNLKSSTFSLNFVFKMTGKCVISALFLPTTVVNQSTFTTCLKEISREMDEFNKRKFSRRYVNYFPITNLLDLDFISDKLDRLQPKYLQTKIYQIEEQLIIYPLQVEVDYVTNITLFYMMISLCVGDILEKENINNYKIMYTLPSSQFGLVKPILPTEPIDNTLYKQSLPTIIETKSNKFLVLSPLYLQQMVDLPQLLKNRR